MNNSIQSNLLKSFLIVVLIAVIILEVFFIFGINSMVQNHMYYQMRDNLDYAINSILFRSDTLDLSEILDPNFRQYFENENAQMQIIDLDGNVIFDSLGVIYLEPLYESDVVEAIGGNTGVWSGRVDYSDEKVMSMSRPIINASNRNIGVLRMVIGIDNLTAAIIRIATASIFAGMVALLIGFLLSRYFSKTISKPLYEINEVARKLADGQYKIRSNISSPDELEELSDSLNYMAEEIKKREDLKNDFISSVSHELRTPLTSIKGWASTLINAGEDNFELTRDGLNIILSETDRLATMVEELLDFNSYVSGRMSLEKEQVVVSDFLNEIITQMRPQVLDKGHIFSVDIADNLGTMIVDKDRIKQVFINLFDNAIKFTEEPGVVSLYAKRTSTGQLHFNVRDNGPGISEDDMKRVKDKFFKGSFKQSNIGLGISISDEIIQMHQGELIIESEENKGTIVTIILEGEELNDQ